MCKWHQELYFGEEITELTWVGDRRDRNHEFGYMHQSTSSPKGVSSVLPQPGWPSLKAIIKANHISMWLLCRADKYVLLFADLLSLNCATSARLRECCSPSFLPRQLKADEMPNLASQGILVPMGWWGLLESLNSAMCSFTPVALQSVKRKKGFADEFCVISNVKFEWIFGFFDLKHALDQKLPSVNEVQ